ncbi:MAG: hypothetical protein HQM03_17175 [Magnetococcales bacterium]|nr:hypothetical protein [Magnetococcales bacterium]
MSDEVNVLLIFCEGPHDSAFVKMVFDLIMGFGNKKLKFSEMPSPFDKLFKTAVQMHAAQDMSLDMSHKFFLPDTVLSKEYQMVFIYNCGGKDKYESIRNLLSGYISLFEQKHIFSQGAEKIAQSIKYLFLYDIDADGVAAIAERLKIEFYRIGEKEFISGAWKDSNSVYGRIAEDKAFFCIGRYPRKRYFGRFVVTNV